MTLDAFLSKIYDFILEPLLFLLFGIATISFIWGIVAFIGGDEGTDGRKRGKDSMIYGILGMAIMLSVFGIINIIAGTIGAELPSNAVPVKQQVEDSLGGIRVE